ncbi:MULTISPECIES: Hsp20/alpha crystallin family protein [unclassified Flavobacterium]|uniref:Hsp20/alpha crystallin family protein n=1 Tax=unclassified Flavobacterium TaxID=196869 RepID=UPI003F93EB7A
MSLVKFNERRRPLESLMAQNLFDLNDFFENQLWNGSPLIEDFWNVRLSEPALNIKEEDSKFKIELAAPGFAKKDFEVNIDNGFLNISAEKTENKEDKDENYTRKEFNYNSFSRSLKLPENIKEEDIKATYQDGILNFDLIKKEESKKLKAKQIKIS